MTLTIESESNRFARAGKFGAVGIVGLLVNVAVQFVGAETLGLNYVVAALVATQVSSTANFLLAEWVVFDSANATTRRSTRYAAFLGMNNAAFGVRAPIMWLLTSGMGLHYTVSNLLSLALMTVVRFGIADSLIWRGPAPVDAPIDAPQRVRPWQNTWEAQRLRARALAASVTTATGATVATIAAAAAALRLVNLTTVGLNSDEAVYAGQGAALFRVGSAPQHFSLFRAHPLLLQAVVGFVFRVFGQSDFAARFVVAVVFGVGSVLVTFALGRALHNTTIGLVAAATCAVLPYHVIVSRQVLVDTAMGFFAALSLVLMLRWMRNGSGAAYIGAFAAAGCAALSKEIAVLLFPVLLYGTWEHGRHAGLRAPVLWAVGVYVPLVLPFPMTRLIGQAHNASAFFLWQFGREPNHERTWFFRVLLQYVTPPVLALIAIGLVVAFRRRLSKDRLVLAYLGFFALFFTAWPTKLFPYLFLLVPPACVLAAVGLLPVAGLIHRWRPRLASARTLASSLCALTLLFLGALSCRAVTVTAQKDVPGMADFDVEVQSFAGTKEFAEWARSTPENARFLTIGPSLGNILRFYGDRDSVAMSVSIDPTKRNPAYVPIPNPDRSLRELEVQYVVWDTYSADRSSFYSLRTLAYARKFGGQIVFSAYADSDGTLKVAHGPAPEGVRPLIIVFSVDGGPLPVVTSDETRRLR